jgi:hypothetical protein
LPSHGHVPSAHGTHRFSDGKLCFAAERQPRDQTGAKELTIEWAEYRWNTPSRLLLSTDFIRAAKSIRWRQGMDVD